MQSNWKTFPVELNGGLITNVSPFQQGVRAPGSARRLVNMEPSIEGGYRRIEGFNKWSEEIVPLLGEPLALYDATNFDSTGTTLYVANLHKAPVADDTLEIDGVNGTYTIASGGVSYNSTTKRAILTLTSSLDSSPTDRSSVTFTNRTLVAEGVIYWNGSVYAERGGVFWKNDGSGWTKINTPNYGTVLVNGGSQTGTTLAVDGVTSDDYVPQIGDTFTIDGVDLVYTVIAVPTISSGGGDLSIDPDLDSSPADNAAITWLETSRSGGNKMSFTRINFNGTEKILGVDGSNYPFSYDGTTFKLLTATTDIQAGEVIVEHKNQIWISKGPLLTFSEKSDEEGWDTGSGAGSIRFKSNITDLIVFRDNLIVFTEKSIHNITGSSSSDYVNNVITEDIGCITKRTAVEVGGDVMFLGPDGFRFLSATERNNDFGLALASRTIHDDMVEFIQDHNDFVSTVIRPKAQVRLFGYKSTIPSANARGFLGTQFGDQSGSTLAWGKTSGMDVYSIHSSYENITEVIVFMNDDGYVYQMESGDDFDFEPIKASFYTPFFVIEDPAVRKTMYKLHTFVDQESSFNANVSIRYDFDKKDTINPPSFSISDEIVSSKFGSATFGVAQFASSAKPQVVFSNNIIGSGFSVSVEFNFQNSDPSFTLDALVLEYMDNDRF